MQIKNRPLTTEPLQRVVSTRTGMAGTAIVIAVIAAALLLAFMSRYRDSVDESGATTKALVAKGLIEKGSSGDVIASKGLFETTTTTERDLRKGAIANPSALKGKQATADIYPGEQLVASDFKGAGDSIGNKIAARERAISMPLDSAHGMIGDVRSGDRVDVLAGFNVQPDGAARPRPVLKPVMQNALVLDAPDKAKRSGATGSNTTQNVVLRAPDQRSWDFAFSSEFGKVWIVLRPKAGAANSRPSLVTLERLLFGTPAIAVKRQLRGGR
jgi:Flp pilus assembly protein CpaB